MFTTLMFEVRCLVLPPLDQYLCVGQVIEEQPFWGSMPTPRAIQNTLAGLRPEFSMPVDEPFQTLVDRGWNEDMKRRPTFAEMVVALEGMVAARLPTQAQRQIWKKKN